MSTLNTPVLILNKHYVAVGVASAKHAICMLFRGTAEVVDQDESKRFNTYDFGSWAELSEFKAEFEKADYSWVQSVKQALAVPPIVRLLSYGEFKKRTPKFNRHNVFLRDNGTCFDGSTLVQLKNGNWSPIKDINIGDEVLTSNGCSVVLDKQSKISNKPRFVVKPYLGLPVVCTGDHRFLSNNGHYIKAADLKGHKIMWPLTGGNGRGISLDLALLIGYYAAEGCVIGKDKRHTRFTIAPEEDEIASDIKRLVRTLYDKYTSDVLRVDKRTGSVYRVLGITSKLVASTMLKYVSGNRARIKKFALDPCLFNAGIVNNILRGILAGDGCVVRVRDSVCQVLTTSSRVLALQVQRMMWRVGKLASIVEGRQYKFNPGAKVYFVRWYNSSRHLGKIVAIDGKKYVEAPIQYINEITHNDVVWDISVAVDHNFVTESGIVHNCQYCGRKFKSADLSLDHIIPKSKGGKLEWTNVVCACLKCNVKKGSRPLSECGMHLIKQPVAPARMFDIPKNHHKSWASFVDAAYWGTELKD